MLPGKIGGKDEPEWNRKITSSGAVEDILEDHPTVKIMIFKGRPVEKIFYNFDLEKTRRELIEPKSD